MRPPCFLVGLLFLALIASCSDARTGPSKHGQGIEKDELKGFGLDNGVKLEESFLRDFEPRTGITAYSHDEQGEGEEPSLEPRANVRTYIDDKQGEGSKTRASVGTYVYDIKQEEGKESFAKDFMPRPSITAYTEGKDQSK